MKSRLQPPFAWLVGMSLIACAQDPVIPSDTNNSDESTTESTTGGNQEPDPQYCVGTFVDEAMISPDQKDLEQWLLDELNQLRADGAKCGDVVPPGSPAPLTEQAQLTCAARRVSFDTIVGVGQETFLNTESEILSRVTTAASSAGFAGATPSQMGGLYAAGFTIVSSSGLPEEPAQRTVRALSELPWACNQIMNASFNSVGVGVVTTATGNRRWTIVLAP